MASVSTGLAAPESGIGFKVGTRFRMVSDANCLAVAAKYALLFIQPKMTVISCVIATTDAIGRSAWRRETLWVLSDYIHNPITQP